MKIRTTVVHRFSPVPQGSLGEVLGFKVVKYRGTDTPDDVVFTCIFYGYPGIHDMSPYSVESIS